MYYKVWDKTATTIYAVFGTCGANWPETAVLHIHFAVLSWYAKTVLCGE